MLQSDGLFSFLGAIIENGAGESLVTAVGGLAPMARIIEFFEKHHKINLLRPLLEARMDEGDNDEALHNALAKVYINTAQNPEKFLEENRFYNSRVVGNYCKTRHPRLSVICYKRGGCDNELIGPPAAAEDALFAAPAAPAAPAILSHSAAFAASTVNVAAEANQAAPPSRKEFAADDAVDPAAPDNEYSDGFGQDGYDPAEVNQAAPLTRKEFADALGCSKGHITYLWSEGMPNSSIAAAKAWRLDQKGNLFF